MGVTIQVPPETHEQVHRIAADRTQPIGPVVAAAVARLEPERFWDEMEAAFDRLRTAQADAAAYEAGRRARDATPGDGPTHEPPGVPAPPRSAAPAPARVPTTSGRTVSRTSAR